MDYMSPDSTNVNRPVTSDVLGLLHLRDSCTAAESYSKSRYMAAV